MKRAGEGWGVSGGRARGSSVEVRWAGGPRMTRRTGKKTRPLNTPSTIRVINTRKKYLKKRKIIKSLFNCFLEGAYNSVFNKII